MPRPYRPSEVIRVLEELGWRVVRQRGSHVNLTREGRPGIVTVPVSNRSVPIGTFKEILRRAHISQREFDQVAEEIL